MANEDAKAKAMGGHLCHTCDFPILFTGSNKKTLCYTCGSVNIKPDGDPSENWLTCIMPEGFEWKDPAGVKGPDIPEKSMMGKTYIDYKALVELPLNAQVIYIDAFGKEWSRMDWIKTKFYDPATALYRLRIHMVPRPIFKIG